MNYKFERSSFLISTAYKGALHLLSRNIVLVVGNIVIVVILLDCVLEPSRTARFRYFGKMANLNEGLRLEATSP